ncbi:MAG: glycosyltransferase family 2 protein [Zavarzinella sp.]
MNIFDITALVLAILVSIPFLILATECLLAVVSLQRSATIKPRSKCAILIPAHNEEVMIKQTLERLQTQVQSTDRIVVIADNCMDETAQIARTVGVEVIERTHATDRGKGFALAHGMAYLQHNPPEVVVIVDADCELSDSCLDVLINQVDRTNRPAQGVYLIGTGQETEPKQRISAFAVLLKNLIRPLGLYKLGGPCLLTGTGMAFPWKELSKVELGTCNLVEDMKLGVDLTIIGIPPQLCPAARLQGAAAPTQQAATQQRTRWEHGHLQTMLTQVPRLWLNAITHLRWSSLLLASELLIPPLSLLAVCWVGAMVVILTTKLLTGGSWLPTVLLCSGLLLTLFAGMLAWIRYGRTMLPLSVMMQIPLYILWKLPIYAKFLFHRQKSWTRTERIVEK